MSPLRSLLSKTKATVLFPRGGGRRAFSLKPFHEEVSKEAKKIPDPQEPAKKMTISTILQALRCRELVSPLLQSRAVLEPAMQGGMIGRTKTLTGNAKHGRGRNALALVLAPTRVPHMNISERAYCSKPIYRLREYFPVVLAALKVTTSRNLRITLFSVYLVVFSNLIASHVEPGWFTEEHEEIISVFREIQADIKNDTKLQQEILAALNKISEKQKRGWWWFL